MRVGVFGGSFNPPHLGHLAVAEQAREAAELDHVVWMPNFLPPHKEASNIPAIDRLQMVRFAVQDNPAFDVSTIELDRGGVSYTVDTLQTLHREHPRNEWFLLIGMDSLVQFHTWRSPLEILSLARLVVYGRDGYEHGSVDAQYTKDMILLDAPEIDLSSTMLRGRIAQGRSVRYLIPDAVRQYIEERQLYRD